MMKTTADILLERMGYKKTYHRNVLTLKGRDLPTVKINMKQHAYIVDGYISKDLHDVLVLKVLEMRW